MIKKFVIFACLLIHVFTIPACSKPNDKIPYEKFSTDYPPIKHNLGKDRSFKEMPSPYHEEIETLIEETPWWGSRLISDCQYGEDYGQKQFAKVLAEARLYELVQFFEHRGQYVRQAVHDVLRDRIESEKDAIIEEYNNGNPRIKLELLKYVTEGEAYDKKLKLLNEIIHNPEYSVFYDDLNHLYGYNDLPHLRYFNNSPDYYPIDIVGYHARLLEDHFFLDRDLALIQLSSFKENAARAVPVLISALDDPLLNTSFNYSQGYSSGKSLVATTLADIGGNSQDSITALIKLLNDSQSDVQTHAAASLYILNYKKREQVNFIVSKLKSEESANELLGIMLSLSRLDRDAKKGINEIKFLCGHPDQRVRWDAGNLYKRIMGEKAFIKMCIGLFEHENPEVRKDAIESISEFYTNPDVKNALIENFGHPDPDVILWSKDYLNQ